MRTEGHRARALNGWHPGEVAVQEVMHLPGRVSIEAVAGYLPDQHRIFHSTRLHFLPFTTLDEKGRPWASILTSRDGKQGFISSPSETALEINTYVHNWDPILSNLQSFKPNSEEKSTLASGIGIELSTRRRNKFSGFISRISISDTNLSMQLSVTQALGLCPKYINIRGLESYPDISPVLRCKRFNMDKNERLPSEVINFIHEADSAYLATSYQSSSQNEKLYPSRVGTNHRGGRPGFIRVRPSDGRTIILPNYSGNRLMNSLGNIHVTPVAGLSFPSFKDGSILYITGKAENRFGTASQELLPQVNSITVIEVTGYVFVQDALPVRENINAKSERSPYSPPVRYLAEETPPQTTYEDIQIIFLRAEVHTENLFTITLQTTRVVEIGPSRNAVLDLSDLIRVRSRSFLKIDKDESAENDDCVRTWTVSIPPTSENPSQFSITMRVIQGGLVTPILYEVAKRAGARPGLGEIDMTSYNIAAKLRGIGGDLPIPDPLAACDGGRKLLWIAGGIGLTPFLGLTQYVARHVSNTAGLWDVVLVISTREPDVMLDLVTRALKVLVNTNPPELTFSIHLFSDIPSNSTIYLLPFPFLKVKGHPGRLNDDHGFFQSVNAKEREAHICGPLPFIQSAMTLLDSAGVDAENVKRERFTY